MQMIDGQRLADAQLIEAVRDLSGLSTLKFGTDVLGFSRTHPDNARRTVARMIAGGIALSPAQREMLERLKVTPREEWPATP